nr:MAG TPA: hypothetical protein [Caudoviricetes sp.]
MLKALQVTRYIIEIKILGESAGAFRDMKQPHEFCYSFSNLF